MSGGLSQSPPSQTQPPHGKLIPITGLGQLQWSLTYDLYIDIIIFMSIIHDPVFSGFASSGGSWEPWPTCGKGSREVSWASRFGRSLLGRLCMKTRCGDESQ